MRSNQPQNVTMLHHNPHNLNKLIFLYVKFELFTIITNCCLLNLIPNFKTKVIGSGITMKESLTL